MNATKILKYGHVILQRALEKVPAEYRETAGVCGTWSVKDIVIHILSYEEILVEILSTLLEKPHDGTKLARNLADSMEFNDFEVMSRQHLTWEEVWDEYITTHEKAMTLIDEVPLELRRTNGVLEWYGDDSDLEDLLVTIYYAHKREHSAQINLFSDKL